MNKNDLKKGKLLRVEITQERTLPKHYHVYCTRCGTNGEHFYWLFEEHCMILCQPCVETVRTKEKKPPEPPGSGIPTM